MNTTFKSTLFVLALAGFAHISIAQTSTEALSACVADNTSGKDRKDLARWVFFAMASHPEIKQFSSPNIQSATGETDRTIAKLFTRLLAESCLSQTQVAYKQGGSKAIEIAFQTFGQLAMQEIMSNPEVSSTMSRFQSELDEASLRKAFGAN